MAAPMMVTRRASRRWLEEQFNGAAERARRTGRPALVSVSEAAEPFDPVVVYESARARGLDAMFWHVPWQDVALVGAGSVWAVTAAGSGRFEQASRAWRALMEHAVHVVAEGVSEQGGPEPGPVLLGGFAFDAGSATGPWEGFGDGRLTLPRVLYGASAGRTWMTVNTLVTAETDPARAAGAALEALEEARAWAEPAVAATAAAAAGAAPAAVVAPAAAGTPACRVAAEDVPPKDEWLAAVREVAAAIRGGALEKAVLARSTRLTAVGGFDIGAALRYLQAHYPECYVFAVGRGHECFIGATPERIVHKRDGVVQVACMAGSIGRGATPGEDERLGRWLLSDPKNMEEHRVVLRSILQALAPVCTDVRAAETGLRKLANVQHLYTPVTARAGRDADVLALVARVHPTPAIGGWPTADALKLIREKENLDRGWYAGPIGWMDGAGDGEFAVGLRSALVQGETALLFAGCGIMGDSDPESEYEESVLKMRPMRAALGAGR